MLSFTLEQLYGWLGQFMWPFVRMLALIGTAPLFSESTIPARVKVGLAAMLAMAVSPAIAIPDVSPGSYDAVWLIIQQVLIGISMGLTMRVVFAAVQAAGELVGLQMGLSFASFFDPSMGANTAVLSRLFNVFAMLLFLALDGHLLLLATLVRSFDTLPISAGPLDVNGWGVLTEWGSQILMSGLLLALPLITVLLTGNLAMGILNRTVPQMSVFAVGFPISLTVGLVILMVVLPQTTPFIERMIMSGFETMSRVVDGLAGR
ncbi:Flagellar biosynthesis protein FliR [plant metagenome]|uniref:Flagellar biosynthetic protein FliR n=2 Tax=root TaxID=1 RepID=A0A1C3JZ50_9BURK|nr:flagellar biosynthetic protein FliR [Orrella dioscoreae]SBT24531.1 Flagellar biosynthesis protein FliR [Orrella dioscoreae]SOE49552.1 Flagellar biosynthesis protein FliR [Orrella dioscoreae]